MEKGPCQPIWPVDGMAFLVTGLYGASPGHEIWKADLSLSQQCCEFSISVKKYSAISPIVALVPYPWVYEGAGGIDE